LTKGTIYYVRVTAHNSLGYGAPSLVSMSKPMQQPSRATNVELAVLDASDPHVGTSLLATWESPADAGGDPVTHYRVEWATAVWTTVPMTVQTIQTYGTTQLSGSFRVSVDTTGTACGTPNTCPVQGVFVTSDIPFDASALEMQTALQNLPNVDPVDVARTVVNGAVGSVKWVITFTSQVTVLPALLPDAAKLSGTAATVGVCAQGSSATAVNLAGSATGITCAGATDSVAGYPPSNYAWVEVRVQDVGPAPYSYRIPNLVPGVEYWVRVSARNAEGYGMMKETAPQSLWPPIQPPTAPVSPFHADGLPTLYRRRARRC